MDDVVSPMLDTTTVMGKDIVMKRVLTCIMVVFIMFSLVGCSEKAKSLQHTITYSELDDAMLSTTSYITLFNGCYYYANPDDEYRLYRMDGDLKNPLKLSEHANAKMGIHAQNADGKLFYLQSERTNDEETPFSYMLFCYDPQTETEKSISERNIISFTIYDGWIYFETISPSQSCRMRLDGSDMETFGKEYSNILVAQNLCVYDEYLIYSCNESITKISLDRSDWKSFQGYSIGFVVFGSSIYNISYNNDYALEKYNAETMEYSDMDYIVDNGVKSFTIIGDLLIYANEDGNICMTGIDGGRRIVLAQGYAPAASKDYLFYLDQNGKFCSTSLNYNDLVDMLYGG